MWRTACLPLHELLVFDGTCGEIYQSYDPMGNRIVSKNTRRGSPHRCFGFTNCVKEAMFRRYVQLNISLSNTTHTQNRNHHLQTKQVRFSLVCKKQNNWYTWHSLRFWFPNLQRQSARALYFYESSLSVQVLGDGNAGISRWERAFLFWEQNLKSTRTNQPCRDWWMLNISTL